MRAYHFLSEYYAIDDLERKRLKISRICELNDPFEMMAYELNDQFTNRVFEITKEYFDSRGGIICFCKNWDNPLLWSHYADKHKGICLGFDLDDKIVIEISYEGERLARDFIAAADLDNNNEGVFINQKSGKKMFSEEIIKRNLFTKYKDWQYENEVRLPCFLRDEFKDEASGLYFVGIGGQIFILDI